MDCATPATLTDGTQIYPHRPDLWHKRVWKCPTCPDSYVGCHGETDDALGRPAGPELRRSRMDTHAVLDPLWRNRDGSRTAVSRSIVYGFLRHALRLRRADAHVGLFDLARCAEARVILASQTPDGLAQWGRDHRAYLRIPDEDL
jgi:hypothetical protein